MYYDVSAFITSLGEEFICNCTGLTSITFESTTPPTAAYGAFETEYGGNFPIYVPAESVNTYKTSTGSQTYESWSYYADRIQPIPN